MEGEARLHDVAFRVLSDLSVGERLALERANHEEAVRQSFGMAHRHLLRGRGEDMQHPDTAEKEREKCGAPSTRDSPRSSAHRAPGFGVVAAGHCGEAEERW